VYFTYFKNVPSSHMLRYDTIRYGIFMCAQKQASIVQRTAQKRKNKEKQKQAE